MPENKPTRTYTVLSTSANTSRPDTRVEGVAKITVDEGILYMLGAGDEVLFIAPVAHVSYAKEIVQQGVTTIPSTTITTTTGYQYTVNGSQVGIDAKAIHAALIKLKCDGGKNLGLA